MCVRIRFRIYGKCFLDVRKHKNRHLATANTEGYVISLSEKVHPVMSQPGRIQSVCVYNTHGHRVGVRECVCVWVGFINRASLQARDTLPL